MIGESTGLYWKAKRDLRQARVAKVLGEIEEERAARDRELQSSVWPLYACAVLVALLIIWLSADAALQSRVRRSAERAEAARLIGAPQSSGQLSNEPTKGR